MSEERPPYIATSRYRQDSRAYGVEVAERLHVGTVGARLTEEDLRNSLRRSACPVCELVGFDCGRH